MFIVLLLLLLLVNSHRISSQTTVLLNCSFLHQTYLSNAAVIDQFQFHNQTAVQVTSSYAFSSSSIFELGLIYQFPSANSLVPFPIIFDCASLVRSCQLKSVPGTAITARDSEPIRVPLTSFHYTTSSGQLNQMGLYLKEGRYQLNNCSLNNGEQMTDPNRIFDIQIDYEKSIGSSCDSTSNTTCGSPALTSCSSSRCTCLSSASSPVSYSGVSYCADMMTVSNCGVFPSRCITWCNETTNALCICPSDTLKIQRQNQLFICELPVDSSNCSIHIHDIRRCSLGQCCFNDRCLDCSLTKIVTSKSIDTFTSIDDRLRIALGVVAGLLGTSIIILVGVFCWLRQRQKHRRMHDEKSLSTSSSLYISPIAQQDKLPSSTSTIYQIPYLENAKISTRTDSFRQAVSSGNYSKQIIEHVSRQRDSFIYANEGYISPTFSTLPSTQSRNIYHTIISPAPVLAHVV